jgi:hypothetical protein
LTEHIARKIAPIKVMPAYGHRRQRAPVFVISMCKYLFVIRFGLLAVVGFVSPLAQMVVRAQPADDPRYLICQMIETAARENGLPVDFFARLIWQESRFQPDEVGPLTRNGEHAQGIAQFMPGTATERQLYEPFDPVEALPKSGEYLAELRNEFGNLGLAAAAYNAGPERVRAFLGGARELPGETRRYVLAVTGRSIDDWAMSSRAAPTAAATSGAPPTDQTSPNCHDLVALLERTPDSTVAEWPGHKVPSWCRALHHPNTSMCGPVHLSEMVMKVASAMFLHSHVHLFRSH